MISKSSKDFSFFNFDVRATWTAIVKSAGHFEISVRVVIKFAVHILFWLLYFGRIKKYTILISYIGNFPTLINHYKKGAFGTVFEVEKSEQFFAMKEINCKGRSERAEAKKEAELMLKLDHQNIVKIFEFFQIKTKIYMVMEMFFTIKFIIPKMNFLIINL